MKIKLFFASMLAVAAMACNQPAQENQEETAPETEATPEEASAEIFFVNLKEGDVVKSPVVVEMGAKGIEVEPAGEKRDGYGHHHIIINGPYLEEGTIVPANETNIHYGKGQTSDTLDLEPGEYVLTLQFADGLHQSYGYKLSSTVKITVE